MKKEYSHPSVMVVGAVLKEMTCVSAYVKSDNGIGFGGTDENGERSPEGKSNQILWDEDDL